MTHQSVDELIQQHLQVTVDFTAGIHPVINKVPACSASPDASHGRYPSADDSSESPTRTSDSPET